jgi:NAD(P)-dependent dehydrogenase (short-subunit alcohol dehydrogenase family)
MVGRARAPRLIYSRLHVAGKMADVGRTAWVTGGGRGIGRACAVALAKQGHSVAVTARTEEDVRETARLCDAAGARATYFTKADATRPEEVEAALDQMSASVGFPEVLVNNAGLARSEAFLKTTPDMMDQMWALNVMGAFHAVKLVLPHMVENKWGRIVNMASVSGKVGSKYVAAYATSKHGLIGLTRSVAVEFADKGVTVNAVCPGYVDTMQTVHNIDNVVRKTGMDRAEARKRFESFSPQGRLTAPEEVAALVAFLCTEAAGNINGQAINIDGGTVQW